MEAEEVPACFFPDVSNYGYLVAGGVTHGSEELSAALSRLPATSVYGGGVENIQLTASYLSNSVLRLQVIIIK